MANIQIWEKREQKYFLKLMSEIDDEMNLVPTLCIVDETGAKIERGKSSSHI